MDKDFSVQEVIIPMNDMEKKCYFVLYKDEPIYQVNKWLEFKGMNSEKTSRRYAYTLIRFFNFLSTKNKSYEEATKKDVFQFVEDVLFGEKEKILKIESNVSFNTASNYLVTIKEFYKYLEDISETNIEMHNKKTKRKKTEMYLYGQIWDLDEKEILHTKLNRIKNTKEYIKWYSEDEIAAIIYNFNTIRDKAIFLLTLEGMRIDEVLSLTLDSYNEMESYIKPNRTKNSHERIVPIRERTQKAIDDYLFNERSEVEAEAGILGEELFINLKKGKNQGKNVGYRSILEIIKKAAEKAGMDRNKIRSHSGRSTRVMEILKYQAKNPNENITDEQIRLLMGWNSADSIKPYVNNKDQEMLINIAKKINKRESGKEGV